MICILMLIVMNQLDFDVGPALILHMLCIFRLIMDVYPEIPSTDGCTSDVVAERYLVESKKSTAHAPLACGSQHCAFPLDGNHLCVWSPRGTSHQAGHKPRVFLLDPGSQRPCPVSLFLRYSGNISFHGVTHELWQSNVVKQNHLVKLLIL